MLINASIAYECLFYFLGNNPELPSLLPQNSIFCFIHIANIHLHALPELLSIFKQ